MVDMKQPVEKAELDMQREDHQFRKRPKTDLVI